MYDFEALLNAMKRLQATKDLLFENEHVPVSVSLADTLNRQPEHTSKKNSGRADPEILGGTRSKACRHPRTQAALNPGGIRFPAGAAANAYEPMVFPNPISGFQLRAL